MASQLIALLFLISAIIFIVEAAVYNFPASPSTNLNYPDHCYDAEIDAYYKPRSEFYQRKGKCTKIWCYADFSMSAATCGAVQIDGCEKLPMDFSKPYPDCCHKFKCGSEIRTPQYA